MRIFRVAALFALSLASTTPGLAQEASGPPAPSYDDPRLERGAPRYRGPFAQGRVRASIIGGANGDYLVLGGGLGYYVLDGLEVGLSSQFWLIGSPRIITLSPQVRYVAYFVPFLKPYAGVFYEHGFVSDNFDDYDSIGGRVGAFWVSGGGSYFGGGAVFEQTLDCPEFRDCFQVLPEVVIAISF